MAAVLYFATWGDKYREDSHQGRYGNRDLPVFLLLDHPGDEPHVRVGRSDAEVLKPANGSAVSRGRAFQENPFIGIKFTDRRQFFAGLFCFPVLVSVRKA